MTETFVADAGGPNVNDLDSEPPAAHASSMPIITAFVPPTKDTPDTMVRMWVSYALLGLLAIVVLVAFASLFGINGQPISGRGGATADQLVKDSAADHERLIGLMNIVFGPVVTLFSSVVGFYFGARTAKEGAGN